MHPCRLHQDIFANIESCGQHAGQTYPPPPLEEDFQSNIIFRDPMLVLRMNNFGDTNYLPGTMIASANSFNILPGFCDRLTLSTKDAEDLQR